MHPNYFSLPQITEFNIKLAKQLPVIRTEDLLLKISLNEKSMDERG
jgi:hypothetical protein